MFRQSDLSVDPNDRIRREIRRHILKILGIENGHRSNVTFIVENGEVKIVNSAAYAMNNLKKAKDKEAA